MVAHRLPALICLAALVLTGGCRRQKDRTVEDVAAALRANGLPYDVSETAALAGIPGDGLRLSARDLLVEVYRIDDNAQRHSAEAEAAAPPGSEAQGAPPPAPKCYVRPPFLIIVRREPAEGDVLAALARAFGD